MLHHEGHGSGLDFRLSSGKYGDSSVAVEATIKAHFVNMSNNERAFRFKVSEHEDKRDNVLYGHKVMEYPKDSFEAKWRTKEFESNQFRRWNEKRGIYDTEEVEYAGKEHPKKEFYLSSAERQYQNVKGHPMGHLNASERDDLDYRRDGQKLSLDARSTRLHHNGLISPHSSVAPDRDRTGREFNLALHRTYNCRSDFDLMNGGDVPARQPELTRSLSSTTDRQEIGSQRISNKRSLSLTTGQDDGIMAANGEDSIINLSSREGNAPVRDRARDSPLEPQAMGHTNGDTESQDLSSPQGLPDKRLSAGSPLAGSKRKSRSSGDTVGRGSPPLNGMHQSVLMLAAQHGLTPAQIQQMLVAQQSAVTQQLMQAQQSVAMQQQQKAHEQALVQLNEQLQLNMLQQAQLLQEKKLNGRQSQQQLQSLAMQQQQIMQNIQQLQLQQRQLLVACLMTQPLSAQTSSGVMSPGDLHQIWKELSGAQNNSEDGIKPGMNGFNLGAMNGSGSSVNPLLSGGMMGLNGLTQETFPFTGPLIGQPQVKQEEGHNPLYRHGMCKWPGCDTECPDHTMFQKHLNCEHTLDDKNTAQARVQMQIVNQLEMQLTREKELLHAMMQHLHLNHNTDGREERGYDRRVSEKMMASPKMVPSGSPVKPIANCLGASSLPKSSVPPPQAKQSLPHHRLTPAGSGLSPLIIPPQTSLTSMTPVTSGCHQTTSQPATPTGLGPMRRRVSDKCNLPISAEIQRNRDFYKNTDVRPPFTYASLIRQAIIESENKQLTLNEVYQWFQNTFAYFRRNEATWKNAVRHNLSLHKCFMRVENVKGAVWTVDEIEFYKRRPQKLTGAIPGSPSMSSESAIYGDTLNASLRAALEQNGLLGGYQMTNGSMSDGGAEDLSMKSHCNSNDSFDKSQSPPRDDSVFMKPFHYPHEDQARGSPRDYSTHGLDLSPRSGGHQSPMDGQHSPKGRKSSPVTQSSLSLKHFLQDPNESEPMDVHCMNEGAAERQQHNQGLMISGEHEAMHRDSLNFKMLAPHLRIAQMEQTEALNMKQEVEATENYESHQLDLTQTERSQHEEQSHEENEAEMNQEVKVEGEDLSTSPVENDNDVANSPKSERQSPAEQIMTNQGLFSPLLHGNNVSSAVVSHSMS